MRPALRPLLSGLIGLALLSGQPASAVAQLAHSDTLHLSLADVLTRVREEHPIWKAGSARVTAARARAAEQRAYPTPSIHIATARLTESRLELLQPLRWPWEGSALKRIGVQEVAATAADAETNQRAVLLEAGQRFADGLRSRRMLALAMESESLAQHTVDEVAPGKEPDKDADLAQLQTLISLDEARRGRMGAALQHTISQARLDATLGQDPGTPIDFRGELDSIAPVTAPEAALATALATDPTSSRLHHEAVRANEEIRLARARGWPTIEAGPAATVGDKWRLGIALGFNLPAWSRLSSVIRAAKAERVSAEAQFDVRHREIAGQVTEALLTLTRTDTELKLLREGALARAARALELAEQVAPQRGTYILAWLAARQAYLGARLAELDLEWQAAQARLLLRHLSGSLVMEEK
jgi:outer membrane protein TolC